MGWPRGCATPVRCEPDSRKLPTPCHGASRRDAAEARPIVATSAFPKGTVMQLLRTALVSALVGVSMSSFAAMPNADPDAREARMQEALQHYYAKQETMNE